MAIRTGYFPESGSKGFLTNARIYGKMMDKKRKLEIFSQMIRHLTALVYLVAELVIGYKPEKL